MGLYEVKLDDAAIGAKYTNKSESKVQDGSKYISHPIDLTEIQMDIHSEISLIFWSWFKRCFLGDVKLIVSWLALYKGLLWQGVLASKIGKL